MSISFSESELINIAIGIERRGIAFYDIMTRSTNNAEARDAFQQLADMERDHIQIFQGMLGEADKSQPTETYGTVSERFLVGADALTKITGERFGGNRERWSLWWSERKTGSR